jgi:hypothetical protein
MENLAPFQLDDTEHSLFSQFSASGYYVGLLRHSGIPDKTSFRNVGTNTPYNLPSLPGVYVISPTKVPGLHKVLYGSPTQLSDNKVKEDIIGSMHRVQTARNLSTTTPEFAAFSSHAPFEVTVPSIAIEAGFYRKLNALQGYRQMFYTSAAFHTRDSSLLWQFIEAMLPRMVAK